MNRVLWPDLEPEAVAEGWIVDAPVVKSADVVESIAQRHPTDGYNGMPGRWVFAREVQASTGSYADVQRFDAVAIGLVPSTKYARVVYEVKVSRSDWLRELRPRIEATTASGHHLSRAIVDLHRDDAGIARLEASGYLVDVRAKWDAALAVSTEFWIAAPPRCVLVDELPPEAGLLEIRTWGPSGGLRPRVVRPAPVRQTPIPDVGFWAAVLRRVAAR